MSRIQLLLIRLSASLLALLLLFIFVRVVWFPDGYFALSGVGKLLLVLLAVNLVLGPGLSTLVYKPGKPGLRFDLVLLACVECAAIGWTLVELDERRPAFSVFAVDRIEVVTRAEVDPAELVASGFAASHKRGPQLVYAALPGDIEGMNRLIDETVFQGMQDIDRRPEFWRSYAEGIGVLLAAARPLQRLLDANEQPAAPLRRWLTRHDGRSADFAFLPLRARSGDGIMIIDAQDGTPAAVLAVDPWAQRAGGRP